MDPPKRPPPGRKDANGAGYKKSKNAKRSDGKPSRPLSAYNCFFKTERVRLLEEISHRGEAAVASEVADASDGGTALSAQHQSRTRFQMMGKVIGKRWRGLSPQQRQQYEKEADDDMKRYRHEVEEYNSKMIRESTINRAPPGSYRFGMPPTQGSTSQRQMTLFDAPSSAGTPKTQAVSATVQVEGRLQASSLLGDYHATQILAGQLGHYDMFAQQQVALQQTPATEGRQSSLCSQHAGYAPQAAEQAEQESQRMSVVANLQLVQQMQKALHQQQQSQLADLILRAQSQHQPQQQPKQPLFLPGLTTQSTLPTTTSATDTGIPNSQVQNRTGEGFSSLFSQVIPQRTGASIASSSASVGGNPSIVASRATETMAATLHQQGQQQNHEQILMQQSLPGSSSNNATQLQLDLVRLQQQQQLLQARNDRFPEDVGESASTSAAAHPSNRSSLPPPRNNFSP